MAIIQSHGPFREKSGHRTVPAGEFVRSFSKWREVAYQHPVEITNHGRVSHVLTAVDYFERLVQTGRVPDVTAEDWLFGLADWVDEAIVVCNAAEEVVYANRVANAICQVHLASASPMLLRQALPAVEDSLLDMHFRRTLTGREPTSADLPSPFQKDGWLHFRSFPLHDMTVMMFRDITEDVQHHRLADVKQAMLQAISVHSSMGYIRLSMRGMIERADATVCQWLGLTEDRLRGVPLVNLMARHSRVACREAFEAVFDGKGPRMVDCAFMSNGEGEVPIRCSIVQLHGAYGVEGLVIVFTRDDSTD